MMILEWVLTNRILKTWPVSSKYCLRTFFPLNIKTGSDGIGSSGNKPS